MKTKIKNHQKSNQLSFINTELRVFDLRDFIEQINDLIKGECDTVNLSEICKSANYCINEIEKLNEESWNNHLKFSGEKREGLDSLAD